ncbi:MAG: aminopeptidase P family protein [Planctomycetales bacterium]|nr:aminopeptidase P family protein [Planctomycetales bacterium]
MSRFAFRRDQLRKRVASAGANAILITNPINVSYLTGFTGDDSYLIVDLDGGLFLSDPRYEEQIAMECFGEQDARGSKTPSHLEVWIRKPGELLMDVTCQKLRRSGYDSILIEGDYLSVNMHRQLSEHSGVRDLIVGDGEVEALRVIKDSLEIETLRRAVELAERVFTSVRSQLTRRLSELDVANEIDRLVRKLGGSGCSFPPIVAVGARAALPHARSGRQLIGSSPFLLVDWGATLEGYRSDLTRVVMTSKIPAKFGRVYETVLAAQQAAIAAMKPGVLVSEIDSIARDVIHRAGMGKRFNHGLGHGIGLAIHEAPRLGKNQDRPLEPGMVVTVEPGVYYPGFGGVRIEDDVLITNQGCELLSTLPREMEANQVQLLD